MAAAERASLYGLCPSVNDSNVTPMFWIDEA